MLDIFTSILDLIAPPPESVRIIRGYTPTQMHKYLSPQKTETVFTLASFHNPVIHAAIVANKFHNYPKAAALLATLLADWLHTLPQKNTCLIPIPLGAQRAAERGYNQVERIISAVRDPACTTASLLGRTKETAPQTSLSRNERLRNMTDAFTLIKQPSTASERFIIVDDVTTTGATLRAAAVALSSHLPPQSELLTVAIAH